MITDAFVKRLRNKMREDKGLNGDAQRIEQLAWMLFLKIFDDREKQFEEFDPNYASPIPIPLKWRTWAIPEEGLTGDKLLEFVNSELLPQLQAVSTKSDTDKRHLVVRTVMDEAINYMRNGTIMRQIINMLNELDFNRTEDRHAINDIYEKILKDLQAGDSGEFYTPRPLTHFIVEMVNPKLGDTVFDPACGTGGFLVDSLEHLRAQAETGEEEMVAQNAIRGIDAKQLPHVLCMTNLLLHGIDAPTQIKRNNTLARPTRDYGPSDFVDVIVTNPPFGGTEEPGIEKNFPANFQTRETADLFLYLITRLLKPGGRCGIVLPDSILSGDGVKARLKEELMTKCNLHTIVRLPGGEFTPYAAPKVCLLFFEKGTPTKETWFYELPLPDGVGKNGFTKTKPLLSEHLQPIKEWWGKRDGNDNAWAVPINEVRERGWSLHFSNPNKPTNHEAEDVGAILSELEEIKTRINSTLAELQELLMEK